MNIIIAGGGITGLATAIALRRGGHKVTIYEQSSLNNEIGAAITVPPNVSRFLIPWDVDLVRFRFAPSAGMYFMSPTTLDELVFHDHSPNAELFGAPLYCVHRVDLHESLKYLATEPDGPGNPVTLHLKSGVRSYNPDTPSIALFDGTIITADLVVAADGINSTASEAILGKTSVPQSAKNANCCYRFLIPTADLDADPETKFWDQGHRRLGIRVFADHAAKRRLIVYACRNHEMYNFVVMCNNDDKITKREDWHVGVEKTEVLEKLAGYHPKILAIINKATEVKRWPLLYRSPVQTWHKGGMVLAGDAAHPMLPNHGQGCAQGIEDALALGLVLHGVTHASQIEERLVIFEKIRRNRAASIQILSNFGYDETVPEELADFLEGRPLPKSINEMIQLAYGHDVVQRAIECMTEFDPSFKIPDGFFPGNLKKIQVNGNGDDTH